MELRALRAVEEPIPSSERYLATVRRASGIPSCSSSLQRVWSLSGMGGILVLEMQQQPLLHRLPGHPLLPDGAAEKVAQGIGTLPALEKLVPHGTGYGRGVQFQNLRQRGQAHGRQLGGAALKKCPLGIQNGLRAAPQGAAPAFQTFQQPLGLPQLFL